PARPRQISGPARPGQIKWSGPAASIGSNASRPGVSERPLGGRARENRKFIQAPSPEIWSETISGGEEVLAGKWGGLVLGYLLGNNFFRRRDRDHLVPPRWMGAAVCRAEVCYPFGREREASGSETARACRRSTT